jgi:excinuclease ABC subunit C
MKTAFDYKSFLKQLTNEPGIYQMLNAEEKILYVGKAKNLNKRVRTYFLKQQNPRIASLVSQIHNVKVITTKTENEALLLENNLIKSLKPRYNILFRDDKSYPYIYLSTQRKFPSLSYHRGAKAGQGKYFGPFPSGTSVRHSLNLLQKLFQVRQCSESFFKNRSRPCMQYQIKRCTAPCVNKVSQEDYAESVKATELFLEGKGQQLIQKFMDKMQQAATEQNYEAAAKYRDQINSLRHVQEKQTVMIGTKDLDIISLYLEHQQACVEVLFVRAGSLLGDHNYFCKITNEQTSGEILEQFIAQFYLSKKHTDDIPKTILVDTDLEHRDWLEEVLTEIRTGKVEIKKPIVGEKLNWLALANKNAKLALQTRINRSHSYAQKFKALQSILKLSTTPTRIECFDISHTMGEATVASCVVFNDEGPNKQAYRRFNIRGITRGDDYAAMKQALIRRYQRLKNSEAALPNIVLIDGGKGQLKQAELVFEELQLPEIAVFGIVKGEGRKAVFDRILLSKTYEEVPIDHDTGAMHLLQELRNEAHRFAIGGHTAKREKKRTVSVLEEIEGIGAKRRQQLLNYFGGLQALKQASKEQIAQVPGISLELAKKIAGYFE